MRAKLLIVVAGLAGMASLPGHAKAQPWGGPGWGPPPRPFWGPPPRPFPPPFLRPHLHVYYAPPVIEEPPPPPYVYYEPPYYRSRVYAAPRVRYRSHVVHHAVHRTVQPAAAPCTCALPAATQPSPAAPSLPALRAAPQTDVYPPESTEQH